MKKRVAHLTGTGRRLVSRKGKQFIFDHLKEIGNKLPKMRDENGVLQNHSANLKKIYKELGHKGVKKYLKECKSAIRRAKTKLFFIKIKKFLGWK